jgi:aminoglycoside 2'-N-acetyltransferase I
MALAMPYIRVAATAELDTDLLADIRSLLEEVFAGDFTEHDWQHTLGGVHALAYEGDALVGHGSVVERRLVRDGRPLRTGYVEGLGVLPAARRRGYGAAIMRALEQRIREGCELGGLASTDEAAPFYAARGWIKWTGPTEPDGEDAVYVLPVDGSIDPSGTLAADWREGDIW